MERDLNTSWLTTERRSSDVKSCGGMSEILLKQENKAEPMVGCQDETRRAQRHTNSTGRPGGGGVGNDFKWTSS